MIEIKQNRFGCIKTQSIQKKKKKNCGMRELTAKILSISFSTLQCKQSINCNGLNCHRNSNAKSNLPI